MSLEAGHLLLFLMSLFLPFSSLSFLVSERHDLREGAQECWLLLRRDCTCAGVLCRHGSSEDFIVETVNLLTCAGILCQHRSSETFIVETVNLLTCAGVL